MSQIKLHKARDLASASNGLATADEVRGYFRPSETMFVDGEICFTDEGLRRVLRLLREHKQVRDAYNVYELGLMFETLGA